MDLYMLENELVAERIERLTTMVRDSTRAKVSLTVHPPMNGGSIAILGKERREGKTTREDGRERRQGKTARKDGRERQQGKAGRKDDKGRQQGKTARKGGKERRQGKTVRKGNSYPSSQADGL